MSESTQSAQEDRGARDTLTEVMRAGARKLIAQALEAEVADLLPGYIVLALQLRPPVRHYRYL